MIRKGSIIIWIGLLLTAGRGLAQKENTFGQHPAGRLPAGRHSALDDLAYVIDQQQDEARVQQALQVFQQLSGVSFIITTIYEKDDLAASIEARHQQWLQEQQQGISLVVTVGREDKLYESSHLQVTSSLETLLPEEARQEMIRQLMEPLFQSSPLPNDACTTALLGLITALQEKLMTKQEEPVLITFQPDPKQQYGFDLQDHEAQIGHYEQLLLAGGPYPVAWKSVATGRQETVLAATANNAAFPSSIHFTSSTAALSTQPAAEQDRQIIISGKAPQTVEEIYAYQGRGEDEIIAGKLNVISYYNLKKKLVIVPVNDQTYPYSRHALQQQLKAIYGQAVVEWEVVVSERLAVMDWDQDADGRLDDGSAGLLSNYTDEMKQIIKTFKKQVAEEKEAVYLFLTDKGKSAGKLGYMPRKRNYGFVFAGAHQSEAQLIKTIAHELAHGAFRLEHTFETYPALTKGSTENLMDYGSGVSLRKYQWDRIHDPVKMLGWLQKEEEAAMHINPYDYIWEEVTSLTASVEDMNYQIDVLFDAMQDYISSWFDFSEAELTSDNEEVIALLNAIRESTDEAPVAHDEKGIISAHDLSLEDHTYDKIIVYVLHETDKFDIQNYQIKKEAEYALLVFKTANSNREAIKIQVSADKVEALEAYLFGQKEKEEQQETVCASGFCCTKCGRDLTVTLIRLQQIFPNSTLVASNGNDYATLFNDALQIGSFNTCGRQAKLFAQIDHESAGFNATVEGQKADGTERDWSLNKILTYFQRTKGAKRRWFNQAFWDNKEYKEFITVNYYETAEEDEGTHKSDGVKDYYGVWNGQNQSQYHVKIPTQFKIDENGEYIKYTVPESEKQQHRKNIFRYAYGGLLGNEDTDNDADTEDGWLYRGKGAIQLTGKANYQRNQNEIAKWFNVSYDLVGNPDLVATNETVVVYSAIAYILQNVSKIEDIDDMTIDQFSALVNTGNANNAITNVNGATDRKERYNNLVNNETLFKCEEDNNEKEDDSENAATEK